MTPSRMAGPTDAAARFAKAEEFAAARELMWEESTGTATFPDVFVTTAVHSGIAAADVICIRRLGRYSATGAHEEAVKLLESVDKTLARHLSRLLGVKTKAGYSTTPVSNQDVLVAQRSYTALLEGARNAD